MGNGSRQGTMRMGVEEHESVMEEPSGQYLGHFTPGPPSTGWSIQHEKPALKVAQSIVKLLQKHDSLESLMVLAGDSKHCNTGKDPFQFFLGGSHQWTQELWEETFLGYLGTQMNFC